MKKILFFILIFWSQKIFGSTKIDSTDCDCKQAATIEMNVFQLVNLAPNLGFAYYPHRNIGMIFKAEYDLNSLSNLINRPYNVSNPSIEGFRFYAGLVTKSKIKKYWFWKNYLLLGFAKMNRKDDVIIPNYYSNYQTTLKFSNTYQTIELNTCLETKISNKMSVQFGIGYNIIASVLQNDYDYNAYLSRGTIVAALPNYLPFESIDAFKISGLSFVLKLDYDIEFKK
ncbi:MAG: hypothetical protein RJA07_184 [Bacteroidota bacterium]|jgi:hypothetical protein